MSSDAVRKLVYRNADFWTEPPRMKTPTATCLACGEALAASLVRSASLRCHDCRDNAAPLRAKLVKKHSTHVRRKRSKLHRAA